ncbi:hypothetical protein KC332_g11176 [Hortaea werneckii]|nr:hypothetical protein KC350_g10633 [Hortaea werneckii]KAI6830616.1 hypothetical protein KC358_g6766 [Hortaea werneckii]KAI6916559.1 hypothetical protein KC348_g11506 [Hortaea werneckii]KAI6929418.1 hypothetical protein KC341_g10884 [Hortaea werneckii]KAI6963489.1 hypothetical protein KC321_g11188 [Hortaea werneckii]
MSLDSSSVESLLAAKHDPSHGIPQTAEFLPASTGATADAIEAATSCQAATLTEASNLSEAPTPYEADAGEAATPCQVSTLSEAPNLPQAPTLCEAATPCQAATPSEATTPYEAVAYKDTDAQRFRNAVLNIQPQLRITIAILSVLQLLQHYLGDYILVF